MTLKEELYDAGDYRKYDGQLIAQKAFRTLEGIIEGICADGVVNEQEQAELRGWLRDHDDLKKRKPFDLIFFHLEDILEDKHVSEEELEDLRWLAGRLSEWTDADDLLKAVIQMLHGIFHGLISDQKLTDDEIKALRDWVFDHDFLAGIYPYDEISSLLVQVLKDGKITDAERNMLMAFMSEFIDFTSTVTLNKERFEELKNQYSVTGICATDPNIEFEGKTFCLTGEFEYGSRTKVAETLRSLGAKVNDNPSKKVDYLVVGGVGNECWAFARYGRKVEKAIELRKKGHPIIIVCERDFVDAL